MPVIRTKSVWSDSEREDGLRILVTRYVPRGCPTTKYDVWMASLGPTEELLKQYKAGEVKWPDFATAYKEQILRDDDPLDEHNPRIKNHGQKFTLRLLRELAHRQPITLLCHCGEQESHCHRHLLKSLLESSKI